MTRNQNTVVRSLLENIDYREDGKTWAIFSELGNLKARKVLTQREAMMILRWKSPRPTQHYLKNSDREIRLITGMAFATRNERLRMHTLTALQGVKYPAASAMLMFYDPKRYPIIDIRVWKQLYKYGFVKTNPRGQGFRLEEWLTYLEVMREIAGEFGLPVRQIEKRFFDADRAELKRKGVNLYRS